MRLAMNPNQSSYGVRSGADRGGWLSSFTVPNDARWEPFPPRRCRGSRSSNRRCPMGRIVLAFALAVLGLVPLAGPAAAGCLTCFDQITLQTPDRLVWSSGKPVTVVVSAHSSAPGAPLPASGVGGVLRTGGAPTECLEGPLRLGSHDRGGGLYPRVFYPFPAPANAGEV